MRHMPWWIYDCRKYVSIQDVFQLDFNPAAAVTQNTLVEFQSRCAVAAEVCRNMAQGGVSSLTQLFPIVAKVSGKKRKRQNAQTMNECRVNMIQPVGVVASTFDEEELILTWKHDQWNTVEHIITKIGNGTILSKNNGNFHCQVDKCVFDRRLRGQVGF